MGNINNAVWLYIGSELKSAEETEQFVRWCVKNSIKKVLVHVNAAEIDRDGRGNERIYNLIDKCSLQDIEVHGMISTLLNMAVNPEQLLLKGKKYYCVDYHGISNWEEPLGGRGYLLDPSCDEVRSTIADMCCRILSAYPGMAGIHLDFVRYFYYDSRLDINTKNAGHLITVLKEGSPLKLELENGVKTTYFIEKVKNAYMDPPIGDSLTLRRNCYFCFCDRCLKLFEEANGITVPQSLSNTNKRAVWILSNHREAWDEFHAQNITGLVKHIRSSMKACKANSQLSAAIWYNAPYGVELRGESITPMSEYKYFGQKWWQWAEDGLVDFLCPMDYWLSPSSYKKLVDQQAQRVKGKIPLFYGILKTKEYDLDEAQFKQYSNTLEGNTSGGLCFFNYSTWKNTI